MNELVVQEQSQFQVVPVAELRARVNAIKELISSVMVENVDFGIIPYTNNKRVLFKSGAEKICAMFRIADRYQVEDLSTPDVIRYRVKCQGVNVAGEILGEGLGEASTGEEKYRWRAAVCDEEFEATPEPRRRRVYKRGKNGGHYTVDQLMTNPADSANTILKMASKRAKLGMVLSVTACSDDFTQDVIDEDDPSGHAGAPGDEPPAPARQPQRRSQPPGQGPAPARAQPAGEPADMTGERAWIANRLKATGRDLAPLLAETGMASLDDLTPDSFLVIKRLLA